MSELGEMESQKNDEYESATLLAAKDCNDEHDDDYKEGDVVNAATWMHHAEHQHVNLVKNIMKMMTVCVIFCFCVYMAHVYNKSHFLS